MNLPKHDMPSYTLTLPVSKTKVKFRPYTVKERKILTMAIESSDKKNITDTINQILGNCTTPSNTIAELPITDAEFLFYNLRARSESEIVELKYKCENLVDDKPCNNIIYHDLNLLEDLEITDGLSETIQLTDTVGIKLKHQKLEIEEDLLEIPTPDEIFKDVAKHVEFIYDDKNVYNAKDIAIDDLIKYLEELSPAQFTKIEEFFKNEPKIIKKLDLTCSKCGMVHELVVEDIFDFFI